ncbi:MAG: type 4a pilus biogenesis protein PilO [Deltaproteobacteria bacterium]
MDKILSDKRKIIAIALISACLFYADTAFILQWQMKSIGASGKKVTKLKKDIMAFKKDTSSLDKLKNTQAQLSSAVKRLILENQKYELVQYVYDTAGKFNVKITQLKPSNDAKTKEEVINKIKLMPILLNLDLSCDYHQLGRFVNALEEGKYFVSVQDMKILRNPEDQFHHKIVLVLRTYAKK